MLIYRIPFIDRRPFKSPDIDNNSFILFTVRPLIKKTSTVLL